MKHEPKDRPVAHSQSPTTVARSVNADFDQIRMLLTLAPVEAPESALRMIESQS